MVKICVTDAAFPATLMTCLMRIARPYYRILLLDVLCRDESFRSHHVGPLALRCTSSAVGYESTVVAEAEEAGDSIDCHSPLERPLSGHPDYCHASWVCHGRGSIAAWAPSEQHSMMHWNSVRSVALNIAGCCHDAVPSEKMIYWISQEYLQLSQFLYNDISFKFSACEWRTNPVSD